MHPGMFVYVHRDRLINVRNRLCNKSTLIIDYVIIYVTNRLFK